MLISLRTAFLGAGAAFGFFQADGSPVPLSPHSITPAPSLVCPALGQITGNYVLCSGDKSSSLSVSTNSNAVDVEFVYYTAPQTGSAVYAGGTLLGVVPSAAFAGNGPFSATLNNVSFPPVTSVTTFYAYARLSVSDPDLTDASCRPFVEIQVTVQPLPVANAGPDIAICPGGSAALAASGGAGCHWIPATGLSDPDICAPVASPSVTTGYIVTVADANGCTATDAVIVSIHQPLGMTCNDNLFVSIGPDGKALITPDMILEGIDDGLDVYSVTVQTPTGLPVPNPVTCAYLGQTLKVKVTDTCTGSSCWGTIKIEDKIPPVIPCTDIVLPCAVGIVSPDYLRDSLGIAAGKPAITDNCSLAGVGFADIWETVACGDSIDGKADISARLARKWTAKDAYGNTSACEQHIYLKRRHVNELVFPADTVISCETPLTHPAFTGAPYFTDFGRNFSIYPDNHFCDINAVYSDEVVPVCDGAYKIKRNWTVADWCFPDSLSAPGSIAVYHTQLIKVADDKGPAFTCPADLTVSTDPFNCCAIVDLPDVILSDRCSRVNAIGAMVAGFDLYTGNPIGMFTANGSLADFPHNNPWDPDTLGVVGATPCLPPGTHIVTYTALDDCGNSATCSFRLTVADQTPPVAACDKDTKVALGADGVALIDATTFDDGSYDNCAFIHFKARRMDPNACQPNDHLYDAVKFCCSDVGDTVTVVFRVYDFPPPPGDIPLDLDIQNYNECMVRVLVEDKIKPSCAPPPNVTVSCENFDPTFETYGFATSVDNCCLDTIRESRNYNLFDTACNKGTIVRTFRAFDCGGLTSICTQRIVVDYKQDYWIKFPDDKIVTKCDGSVNFGEPIFFGEDCELMGVSYEDAIYTVVTDACYKIERTWNIINWCTYDPNKPCIEVPNPDLALERPFILPGPVVSAPGTTGPWASTVVKVLPTDPGPTDYSIFWDPDANCYRYKQIIIVEDTKDPVISNCPAGKPVFCDETNNDPQQWNAPSWFDPSTGSHDLCEGPVNLTLTATDQCTGANLIFRYLLFLDLDNNGTMETVLNSNDLPDPGTVHFGNAANPNFSGGTPQFFDQRPVPAGQKWRFALQTSINSLYQTATLKWNTQDNPSQFVEPQFPYGTHKIKWIVEDGCGNETVCEYNFTVKDCKAPTIVCTNGLSVNIMPTQMIQLWATDFLQYAQDNCTPPTATIPGPNQIKFAVRKAGTGAGFPADAAGNIMTNVVFTCAELGQQPVELWAQDLAGNADYCQTFVQVSDNNNNCISGVPATVAGALTTELNDGLLDANVNLVSGPLSLFDMTDKQGTYVFPSVPLNSNFTITPLKNDNPLNGVSTYDLVLISKHILGQQPLSSPYKMIAADANKSNSITTFDIVAIRKLILGIYSDFPDNTSWRFVDKDFAFPQPQNPFATPFPETRSGSTATADLNDFVAVKIGDVNNTAIPYSFAPAEDRTSGTLLFDTDDRNIGAGEIFTVTLAPDERPEGFQFTLNIKDLETLEVLPGEGMTPDNFGVFQDAVTVSAENSAARFAIKFRALKSGKLSQMLAVSSRITRAEAYRRLRDNDEMTNDDMTTFDVALRFNSEAGPTIVPVGFELYQNRPNPFGSKTLVGFHLPQAGKATLTVSDASGRELLHKTGFYEKGYNAMEISRMELNAPGVLYYRLETDFGSAVKKMAAGN